MVGTLLSTSFNAGVTLQALMALLGHIKHVSAAMSLRYGKLFDSTVRAEYERALTQAKEQLGTLPAGPPGPAPRGRRRHAGLEEQPSHQIPAGGRVLPARARARLVRLRQHLRALPHFRNSAADLPVLPAQRADIAKLAEDAETRGWITEATRHRKLLERLDTLIARAQPA